MLYTNGCEFIEVALFPNDYVVRIYGYGCIAYKRGYIWGGINIETLTETPDPDTLAIQPI